MEFNEWVSTVDNASSIFMAGMMLIQTIFIGAGFWFGMRYLDQHREKIKEERRLELIKSTKDKVSLFITLANRVFGVDNFFIAKIESDPENLVELLDSFFQEYKNKLKEERNRIDEIRSEIWTNISLLRNENLKNNWNFLFSIQGFELLYRVMEDRILGTDSLERKKKVFLDMPKSYTKTGHPNCKLNRELYQTIQEELNKLYFE